MLILLPPSETKRDGGTGAPVDFALLAAAAEQADARERVSRALVDLARNPTACAKALGLSPRQLDEVTRNASLFTAPTMPAIDRFTGVLFDALGAASLPAPARAFAGAHVAIGSACFGLIGALDEIPAYRLSANSSLPTLGASLKKTWAESGTAALARLAQAEGSGFILDARSEDYAALAPLPTHSDAVYLRVVSPGPDGTVRALNHFNKKAKGEFVRALCLDHANTAGIASIDELVLWANATTDLNDNAAWNLESGAPGELSLLV